MKIFNFKKAIFAFSMVIIVSGFILICISGEIESTSNSNNVFLVGFCMVLAGIFGASGTGQTGL